MSSCAALSERLWAPELKTASIQPNLDYLTYQGKSGTNDLYWIAPKGSQPRAISARGRLVNAPANTNLSVLCTQTAPFSHATTNDVSEKWQVTVKSNNEHLTGFRDRLSFRFFGIRYAPQPERWTYSTPYVGSGNSVVATRHGSQCVQNSNVGSEDCLFLNIWTPFLPKDGAKTEKKDLKPVMFWIHGGAFTSGTANDPTTDGASIASRGDVVMVAINYRLTTLGFLALNDGVTRGNYGLADQINALNWVRKNIRDFGGDPGRITIFGQSAGAASVRAMLASPQAAGKFAGAILMSSLGGTNYATTYSRYYTIEEEMGAAGDAILAATNCTSAASQIECLRAIPAHKLASLGREARYLVVDGMYLTNNTLLLNGTGPGGAKPHVMMGHMRDDGAALIGFPNTPTNLSSFLTSQSFPAASLLSSGAFPQPASDNTSLAIFNATARVATDAEFRCLDQATSYAAAANKVFAPHVYFYEFNRSYQTAGWSPNAPVCEAPRTQTHPNGDPSREYFKCHSGELYYVFGTLLRNGLRLRDQDDLPFGQFTLDSWTSFARKGDPNPDEGFLRARGFRSTLSEVQKAGKWRPVSLESDSPEQVRLLQWPSKQVGWSEQTQCNVLGLPLDYYA